MTCLIVYSILYVAIINEAFAVKFFPATDLPDADIIIDNEKGFLLQRIGVYSSMVNNAILHTFIPLHDLCQATVTSDICLRSSQFKDENAFELGTIMSPKEVSPLALRYKKHDVSTLINKNITDVLSNFQLDKFFKNKVSIFHFFDNHFYVQVSDHNHHESISNNDNMVITTRHANFHFSKSSTNSLIGQIVKKHVGFSFLQDEEIALFLYPLMSYIDKSYAHSSMQQLQNDFSHLIIAQSINILRSCSMLDQDMNTYAPCLIVSTLFTTPSTINSHTYVIYNLHPLPTVVNQNRYMYTNLPRIFGINSIYKTLITWNNDQNGLKCIFSKVVQCEKEPTYVPLASWPCMKQLLLNDESSSNACDIAQSINAQPGIINIVDNIWISYNFNKVRHCRAYSNLNDPIDIVTINESSVLQLPCQTYLTCSDIQLKSSTCSNGKATIKSLRSEIGTTTSIFQYSIKKLTDRLEAEYKSRAIKSLQQLQSDLYNSAPTSVKIFKKLGSLLIYFLLLIVSTVIIAIVKFIEIKIKGQVNTIEKRMNKYADVFSLESETV